jgi:gliding motility-associated-like protein
MKWLLCILLLCTSLYSQQTVELCEGENSTYTYSANANIPGTYTWYLDNSFYIGNDYLITWTDTGTYEIKCIFTSVAGCEDTSIYFVTVVQCDETTFYIPDAFSPDDNGRNDIFIPKGLNINEFEMYIYNRWGELIYESSNIYNGWDGKHKGNLCQQDVYVWIIKWRDIKNRPYQKIGHVTLIQ